MCCRRESSELKTKLAQANQALKTSEVSRSNLATATIMPQNKIINLYVVKCLILTNEEYYLTIQLFNNKFNRNC